MGPWYRSSPEGTLEEKTDVLDGPESDEVYFDRDYPNSIQLPPVKPD